MDLMNGQPASVSVISIPWSWIKQGAGEGGLLIRGKNLLLGNNYITDLWVCGHSFSVDRSVGRSLTFSWTHSEDDDDVG